MEGWAAADEFTQLARRDAVEVQLWLGANVFIGSRSSMSEFAYLARGAARGLRAACQMPSQPCFYGSNCQYVHKGAGLTAVQRSICSSDARYYAAKSGAERLWCTRGQPPPFTSWSSATEG